MRCLMASTGVAHVHAVVIVAGDAGPLVLVSTAQVAGQVAHVLPACGSVHLILERCTNEVMGVWIFLCQRMQVCGRIRGVSVEQVKS